MSENALAVREQTAIEKVRNALDARLDDLESILPDGMDAARFVRVSMIAISKNPRLIECDRASLVMSIIEAAEVGLEPTGGVGGAHLVPFGVKGGGKKAQLILDYRGVQHLIREGGGGEVKTVLVYKGDAFEVYEGTDPKIVHRPKYETTDPNDITHVYAWPLDHPDKFEVMTKAQVDAVRARSRAANDGPWVTDYGPQARKTVLKRISAWLPLRPQTRERLEADTQRELGVGLDEPTETVRSRTAEVRERIQERAGKPKVVKPDAAPAESADQRTDDVSEGDVIAREVCGAEGDGEVCTLDPGHLEKGGMKMHKAASGSVWPAK